jgi:hypothetical protein
MTNISHNKTSDKRSLKLKNNLKMTNRQKSASHINLHRQHGSSLCNQTTVPSPLTITTTTNKSTSYWIGPPAHFMLTTHANYARSSRSVERCPRAIKGNNNTNQCHRMFNETNIIPLFHSLFPISFHSSFLFLFFFIFKTNSALFLIQKFNFQFNSINFSLQFLKKVEESVNESSPNTSCSNGQRPLSTINEQQRKPLPAHMQEFVNRLSVPKKKEINEEENNSLNLSTTTTTTTTTATTTPITKRHSHPKNHQNHHHQSSINLNTSINDLIKTSPNNNNSNNNNKKTIKNSSTKTLSSSTIDSAGTIIKLNKKVKLFFSI